jgi:hypothetical protein
MGSFQKVNICLWLIARSVSRAAADSLETFKEMKHLEKWGILKRSNFLYFLL